MAAKRHHAKHEKHHEKSGMYMEPGKRHEGKDMQWAEYYAGVDPRRRQEMMDGMMLKEDHHAVANLPQNVVYREYPKAGHTMAPYLDDTIEGVDSQMNRDDMMKRKIFSPKKL
jgi:hypothetical protein